MNNKLAKMDYNDFVGAHGGKRTAALAGHFRSAKGMGVNDKMQQAMQRQAAMRSAALVDRGMAGKPGDPAAGEGVHQEGPGVKPLAPPSGGIGGMLGPPDAPPAGMRTSPGTTPRAKTNMMPPWGGRQALGGEGGWMDWYKGPNKPKVRMGSGNIQRQH